MTWSSATAPSAPAPWPGWPASTASLDQICAGYTDDELELLAGFLRRTTTAGRAATEALTPD